MVVDPGVATVSYDSKDSAQGHTVFLLLHMRTDTAQGWI